MIHMPITIKEATAEDIPFLQAMIWQAMLASPTFVAHYGVETLQHLEEQYWRNWEAHPDPAFVALDATGQKLGAITVKPNGAQEKKGLTTSTCSSIPPIAEPLRSTGAWALWR
jgi:hypothetical protein